MSPNDSESNGKRTQRYPWHGLKEERVLEKLDASGEGLTHEEAHNRLQHEGPNAIGGKKEVKWWRVLLNQFQSPLVYVLFVALVVTLAIQSYADSIVIAAVLVINSVVGFIQEYKAENSVQALMEMISPKANVKREGRKRSIPAEELVPGDWVYLREGDVIPADVRLLQCSSLQVNEAPLTGESVPVGKIGEAMEEGDGESLPLSEMANMGFMGTAVTAGKAQGVVVATGRDTEIGRIAGEVEETGDVETPLQRRIRVMTKWIAAVILLVSLAAFGIGWAIGRDLFEMLLLAVALAVAAIPAGLPIVVTVALAIGVERMAKRNAVIRHLPAVDTLGSCTVILSDKTGTLTQNRMTVKSVRSEKDTAEVVGESFSTEGELRREDQPVSPSEEPALGRILLTGLLCNDVELPENPGEEEGEISGDPMEVALVFAARKAVLNPRALRGNFPQVDEVPFQTERRYMGTIHEVNDDGGHFGITGEEPLVLVKGAPEVLLDMCGRGLKADGSETELDRKSWEERNRDLTARGLRVLAMAMARGDSAVEQIRNHEASGFTFLGMQGLQDPARPSAVEAVDACHRAGIRVVMVTGDNAGTAAAIAKEVHIDPERDEHGKAPEARTGRDIHEASDEELDEMLRRVNTFARVEPVQKTRLVDRLKQTNEIVSVTGDGVNDAPALKNAHLGAAMGSGTDVAKEASDMVITDDQFSSVYAAVEQGRTAFRNIRMATFFLLSTGAADVLIILSALALGWPLPLVPAQILWCNVVTNGIADVALASEPGERALFRRPPRPPEEGVLNRNLIERLVAVGIWLAVGVIGVFLWKWDSGDGDLRLARTAALTTLVLFQKVHVFNCKSEDVSVFKRSLLNNKLLLIGVLASLAVHIGAIYWPVTQKLLSLAPMDAITWAVSALVASTAIIVNELHKKFRGRA